jgi:GR25 family glycosyltransferase involved in LPS biosynthesis
MERQLRRVGWENSEFFKAIAPDSPGGFASIGARGCFLSHLGVLKRADDSSLILMEDDLNFSDDFTSEWNRALEALPDGWSIFYPAHVIQGDHRGVLELPSTQAVLCTHFMVISAAAVPTVVRGLETILSRPPGHPDGGPMHVDGAYSTIRRQNPDLKTFASFPSLGYQRSSRSDITASRFDRIPAFRSALTLVRRLRHAKFALV